MKSEVETIKWYVTCMEDAFDAKEIGEKYATLSEEHKTLVASSAKTIK